MVIKYTRTITSNPTKCFPTPLLYHLGDTHYFTRAALQDAASPSLANLTIAQLNK